MIRAAADGADADALIDLNTIDFDALAARLAGRKRSAAQRLAEPARRPGRGERRAATRPGSTSSSSCAKLIDEYNAGSLNVDEMLRRLQSLSRELSEEEQRTVREGLSEPELAVFDLLTKPDPVLTDEQRDEVKKVARKLMEHITGAARPRLAQEGRDARGGARARQGRPRRASRRLRPRDLGAQDRRSSSTTSSRATTTTGAASTTRRAARSSRRWRRRRAGAATAPDGIDVDDRSPQAVLEQIKADPALRRAGRRAASSGKQAFFAVPSEELIARRRDLRGRVQVDRALEPARGAARTSGWRTPSSRRSPASSTPTAGRCSSASTTSGGPIGLAHDTAAREAAERRRASSTG